MIKVIAPAMACRVLDRAIQVHGAGGVTMRDTRCMQDGSARMWRWWQWAVFPMRKMAN